MGCNGLSIPNNRHTALYGLSESDRSHCDKNIKEKKQAEKKRKNLSILFVRFKRDKSS